MRPGPTIFTIMSFVALIAVLCSEHKRVAGVVIPGSPIPPKNVMDEIVGLSNDAVQKSGPSYLQFNLPWFNTSKIPAEPIIAV